MGHNHYFSTLYTEMEKHEKDIKKSKVLLIFDGLSKNIKKYHFNSKYTTLTSDATCFKP